MTVLKNRILTSLLTLVVLNCGSGLALENTGLPYELLETKIAGTYDSLCALPAGQTELRNQNLEYFSKLPLRGCLSNTINGKREYTPYPFQVYSGETNIFSGTADLKYVQDIMADSGYLPLKVEGEQKAFAYVFLNNATGSSVGAYTELFTFYAAYKEGAENQITEIKAPEGTNTTPVLALGVPGVHYYFHRAYLSDQAAIRYGRSIMGFDKVDAEIIIESPSDEKRDFFANDANGIQMLEAKVFENDNLYEKALPDFVKVFQTNFGTLPPPPENSQIWTLVSRLPGGDIETTFFHNRQTAKFRVFNPESGSATEYLKFGETTQLGVDIKNMSFEPTALIWSRDIVASLESPLWMDQE